ncbi:hypothetical protein DFJ77DRAFT_448803 [Powellomyces hirtus]|nr:hypothetical protein DFJ77DRAFT_448803 [Powellomyces hirtus]
MSLIKRIIRLSGFGPYDSDSEDERVVGPVEQKEDEEDSIDGTLEDREPASELDLSDVERWSEEELEVGPSDTVKVTITPPDSSSSASSPVNEAIDSPDSEAEDIIESGHATPSEASSPTVNTKKLDNFDQQAVRLEILPAPDLVQLNTEHLGRTGSTESKDVSVARSPAGKSAVHALYVHGSRDVQDISTRDHPAEGVVNRNLRTPQRAPQKATHPTPPTKTPTRSGGSGIPRKRVFPNWHHPHDLPDKRPRANRTGRRAQHFDALRTGEETVTLEDLLSSRSLFDQETIEDFVVGSKYQVVFNPEWQRPEEGVERQSDATRRTQKAL